MNTGLVTACITQKPIRFANLSYYLTELHINFLHIRNYFASAIAIADGELGQSIFNLYQKGDYLILEGEFIALENTKKNNLLVIYITGVNPAHVIM